MDDMKKGSLLMKQYFEWAQEIRHLSEEQVEALYQRYLNGEKTADLIAEYKLADTVRSVLKVLPPIVSADLRCPYCDLPMWMRRPARGRRFPCAALTNV
ncbi:hypothetical protein RCC30_12050 [Pseudomonas fluorescens]|nr:hypothetical protein RCC30_12050 [Pseudomonas fluorescens]